LLERMSGPAHAEVYAGAYRLLDACNMFGYLFASLLLPMFARLEKQKSPVRPLVSLSFKLIWSGSVTLAAAIFFARADLVRLMMPEHASAYRWETLGVLIWAFVPVCTTYIFSTLLTAHERLAVMNRYFVGGIVLDFILNLWLIPHYQALGAAIAALCTQSFIAASMVWLSLRHFDLKIRSKGWLRLLGFTATVLAADWVVFEKFAFDWKIKFAMAFITGLVALLLFRLLDWRKASAMVGAA
jgi:O-antigen/teichoic acid export membrane protein